MQPLSWALVVTRMKSIQIQIQPELNNTIDSKEVLAHLKENGYAPHVSEGNDEGQYINILVSAINVAELWETIKTLLNKRKAFKSSSIIICEGSESWNNYLLLHHYNENEKLDGIRSH